LKVVGEAWDVGFTHDGEPADGFRDYRIERLPVFSSEDPTNHRRRPSPFRCAT
jgi:hypothetical protein